MINLTLYYTITLLIIFIFIFFLLSIQKRVNSLLANMPKTVVKCIHKTQPLPNLYQSLGDIRSSLLTLPRIKKEDWSQLEADVNNILDNFTIKLRMDFPNLTEDDIQIILLIRIGMDHEEIARICGILQSSFRKRRSRLKKKMDVECNSISEFIKDMYPSSYKPA